MRIDGIILRELHLPLVRPFETSFGVTRNRRILLVEVQSEGLIGWGECTAGERPLLLRRVDRHRLAGDLINELGPDAGRARRSSMAAIARSIFQRRARQSHGQGRARKCHLGS